MASAKTHREVMRTVLARIKPRRDKVREADAFVRRLNRRIAEAGEDAEAMLGGSTAKGTFLRGSHDVDIFVCFAKNGNLSDRLAALLPGAERVHGSRDYFQLRNRYLFEIVPVKRIGHPREAENVTDVSPLHVDYVVRRLEGTRLADDIRLAKQFCKAARVYGAESYIRGLSGHVLDLLVIHYGGFLPLVEAAASWPASVTLDPERHHRDARRALDEAKHGPLLLVDPIQPERNAAAALSREQFERFKRHARRFLQRPALSHFMVRRLTPARIRRRQARGERFIIVSHAKEGKEDIVAAKLRKAHEHLLTVLRDAGFTLLEQDWEYDPRRRRAVHYVDVKERRLPREQERQGPPTHARRDAARFRARHPSAYERDGRLYAPVTRPSTTPRQAVEAALKSRYVRERATPQRI